MLILDLLNQLMVWPGGVGPGALDSVGIPETERDCYLGFS